MQKSFGLCHCPLSQQANKTRENIGIFLNILLSPKRLCHSQCSHLYIVEHLPYRSLFTYNGWVLEELWEIHVDCMRVSKWCGFYTWRLPWCSILQKDSLHRWLTEQCRWTYSARAPSNLLEWMVAPTICTELQIMGAWPRAEIASKTNAQRWAWHVCQAPPLAWLYESTTNLAWSAKCCNHMLYITCSIVMFFPVLHILSICPLYHLVIFKETNEVWRMQWKIITKN